MDAAKLLRSTRRSAGLKQEQLAYRAGTTQTYVSRVERGLANPSLSTLERLFAAMGKELRLDAVVGDCGNVSAAELRRDFLETTPEERIEQAFTLSEFLTDVASGTQGAQHGAG